MGNSNYQDIREYGGIHITLNNQKNIFYAGDTVSG